MTTINPSSDNESEQEKTTKPIEKQLPQRSRQRRIALISLVVIFGVVGIIYFIYWLIWGRFELYTDDAYVGGNIVQVMSQVPGTVVNIYTDDTLLVIENQRIVQLDTADAQVELQNETSSLANTVRQVRQYFENAQAAQAEVILRNADLVKAQLDLKRRTGLVGEKAISREDLQHSRTAYDVAKAQYDLALHKLHSTLALVENTHLYDHPLVERAKANFKKAYLNFQRTTIVAPVTGYVAKRSVQVGQHVNMSTPLLAIIPLDKVWVEANYKESQLSRIRIGQPVELRADTYGSFTYHGKIMGLSAGTGSVFDLLPPQNATGNWIKIVQRLPVRIILNPQEFKDHPLRIGLSMKVTTNTFNLSGPLLATVPNKQPLYTTTVYAKQLKNADDLINKILRENGSNSYFPPSKLPTGIS